MCMRIIGTAGYIPSLIGQICAFTNICSFRYLHIFGVHMDEGHIQCVVINEYRCSSIFRSCFYNRTWADNIKVSIFIPCKINSLMGHYVSIRKSCRVYISPQIV